MGIMAALICFMWVLLIAKQGLASGELPKTHVEYIQSMITQFMATKGCFPSGVVYPPLHLDIKSVSGSKIDFLLPAIIIWNPLVSHGKEISCDICEQQLYQSSWNDGSLGYNCPRRIYGLKSSVLLVSAVYTCKNGHKLLAHDERVLKKLSQWSIPFVLVYKSGFTQDFVDVCITMCHNGMNFHSLERAMAQMYWQYYEQQKQALKSSLNQDSTDSNLVSFKDAFAKNLPSDDAICRCFVTSFLTYEKQYLSNLQSTTVGDCVSIDHTYKVASNIGYLRGDGKWVCQYNSAFIVFNKEGQIVSWQYTKTGSFDEVKSILEALAAHSMAQGTTIQTIYVDNCCQWRNKLQSVFGSTCHVKLDIFHAVQRVVQKIPKKHQFHSQCARDLGLVFREIGDGGIKRTKPTPCIATLVSKLKCFIQKWESIVYDGKCVLNEAAIEETKKLEVHIKKGCLSDIPIGCGTNRNEAFHRYIRTYFHRSRVGILVAYAIMMMIIFQFNANQVSSRKKLVQPIISVHDVPTSTNFEPMGIVKSHHHTDYTWHQECSEEEQLIEDNTMIQILQQTAHQYQLMTDIKKNTTTARELWKFIQYDQIIPKFCTIQDTNEHCQRLQEVVSSWNFSIISVPKDGNCFFTSVALELSNFSHQTIQRLNLCLSAPITDLVSRLRQVIVEEWLGCRKHMYQEFIPDYDSHQYENWAGMFKQNYFYDCELGNTMPLAMSNALGVSLVVFTSHERSSLYYITPTECLTESTDVLYLAYNLHGSGHYDACVPLNEPSHLSLDQVVTCRCGVNKRESDNENYIACANQASGRHSTCKCLAAGQACSSLCKCKDCRNPEGQRKTLGKRKREPHNWQKVNTSCKDFANDREHMIQGNWSKFEDILFANVVSYFKKEMKELTNVCLSNVFNSIVNLAKSSYCTLNLPPRIELRCKSAKQCEGKLQQVQTERNLFEQMQ